MTGLTPDTLVSGQTTTLTGTGTIDEDIPAANYEMTIKAGIVPILDHKGNACAAETITLPLGMGTMSWKGESCPVKAGTVSLGVDAALAAAVPPAVAAGADIKI